MVAAISVGWTPVYLGSLVLAALLTVGLAIVGSRFRSEPGAEWFAATMVLCAVWTGGALVTAIATHAPTLAAAEIVTSGCGVTVPVTWFGFVVSYAGFERHLHRRGLIALFVIPAVSILAMAGAPLTDLYFGGFELVRRPDGITVLNTLPGPLAWLAAIYTLVLFVVGFGLIGRLVTTESAFSAQATWLLAGTVPPFVAAMLEPAGIVGPNHLPLTPIGFALMGAAYGYGLFRHRLFDLSPGTWRIGAATAFEGLAEGIVFVDTDGHVLGYNPSAAQRFGWEETNAFGREIGAVAPALAAARKNEHPTEFAVDGRQYEATVSPIVDAWDRRIGETLVVRDVTERYERRQQLSVLNRVLRHNLRNDMMVVASRAEALTQRYDDPMAWTIVEIAEDLVDVAGKARSIEASLGESDTTPREIEVEPFLGKIVETARDRVGDAAVMVEAPDSLTVTTDRRLLELIVGNLVENAFEHGAPDEGAPVRLRAERTAGGVAFEVEDDGPGIPDSELAVLDDGIETPIHHGSGLGLWLVTWGASWLDAELTFETTDGTTVRLVVPDQ